jgi:hypothetical protein
LSIKSLQATRDGRFRRRCALARQASSASRAYITHIVSAALLFTSVIAVSFTLPSAYKCDEKWQSFSHTALFLGYLILAFFVGCILAPFNLKGLVQRGITLVILVWLLLTGLHL